jgi:hypothetical protein
VYERKAAARLPFFVVLTAYLAGTKRYRNAVFIMFVVKTKEVGAGCYQPRGRFRRNSKSKNMSQNYDLLMKNANFTPEILLF